MITRSDLSQAQRAVQSAHAGIAFIFEHKEVAEKWHFKSMNLVLLEVENEDKLIQIIEDCESLGIKYTIFREPDLDNQITALALEPGDKTKKYTQKFPLLFKEKKE